MFATRSYHIGSPDAWPGEGSTYGDISRERVGKVTMVGLRSETNLFWEKRLMWNVRKGGNGERRR